MQRLQYLSLFGKAIIVLSALLIVKLQKSTTLVYQFITPEGYISAILNLKCS
jgi:hypothetical protein